MAVIFTLLITFFSASDVTGTSVQAEAFQRLDNIRKDKKRQLFDYLEKISKNAEAIKTDSVMLEFFHLKNSYYQLQKTTAPPESLIHQIGELKKNIREHYLRHYLSFYDILFVEKGGDIFYTIRQQSDYHKNIFQGELAKTALAQQLKENPPKTFVDYQYYAVSGEPSAFLVMPVLKEENLEGWFVFQCAINKINNMFTQETGLGETGEVFLVNKRHYMLTDSRFFGDSSILKRHLSRENIAAKFREKSGHKIVVDYRGFRVLSSFEVCRFANSEWLLIAKIDEDEIITEQYKKKRDEIRNSIIGAFREESSEDCGKMKASADRKLIEVDIDEFRKVQNNELIGTYGVSTCTAVIVSFPGKFSYMSHISNLDRIYGGHTTDLIGHILKRIKTFDLYKYERRKLKVTVIANHLETIMNTIDMLVDEGIFLSQIKFMHNGNAQYANLLHDNVNNKTSAYWLMDRKTGDTLRQCASGVETIAEIVKPLVGYSGRIF